MSSPENLQTCFDLLRFAAVHEWHRKSLEKATGETFNLFRILGIGHLEVRTHSPILGDLLNPKGSHGQGEAFLGLFLNLMEITDLDAKRCSLRLEYYAGPIDGESGGRIDLLIQDDGQPSKTVVIENKIFAEDQADQLRRYRNKFPKAHLFYLTLDGSSPGNVSDEEAKRLRFRSISYGGAILPWLESCKKEAASLPGVREMIGQYIHLIGDLTGRSVSKSMNKKLIETILSSPENLDALYALREMTWQVESEIFKGLDSALDSIASGLGVTREKRLENLDQKDSEFSFRSPQLDERNLKMTFSFENRNYRNFCFGFSIGRNSLPIVGVDEVRTLFSQRFACETPNPWWPAWTYFEEPYRSWNAAAFKGVHSGDFLNKVKEKLKAMIEIADQLDRP